jgi:5'-3' exonuclease
MGIYQLHRFIQKYCNKAIKIVHLNSLENQRIVVDTSIYLYKYASEGHLIEGMYNLIIVLKYYKITPVFIFDGKPITEKTALLDERKEKKRQSKYEYYKLKEKLVMEGATEEVLRSNTELAKYKRDSTKISAVEIEEVKKMMVLMGIEYYQADNEADGVCVYMANDTKSNIWGCLSEDTDMFVYGCKKTLRYISLMNHTVVIYDQRIILKSLNMTQNDFVEMCIVAGSDYNIGNKVSIYCVYKLYQQYIKNKVEIPFMYWIDSPLIKNISIKEITKIKEIYSKRCMNNSFTQTNKNIKEYDMGGYNKENAALYSFLEKYNFIFVSKNYHVNNRVKNMKIM